jgi:branched-chain amino acid aminotransferase
MGIWLQPYLKERGADDALYFRDGVVTECPRSNFFMVTSDDVLVTPSRNILKGITRGKILELARRQVTAEERDITLDELGSAKELFITSTGRNILPVTRMDGKPVRNGLPGEMSHWLNQQLQRSITLHALEK